MGTTPRHVIIAGAQRCGTTWLYDMLDQHPAIVMARPKRPEPKFFLSTSDQLLGADRYRALFPTELPAQTRWLGEKSASYLELPYVAQRIAALLDRPKIIVLVREPVARAISNVQFSKAYGYEEADPVDALMREIWQPEALGPVPEGVSVHPRAYLARGRYADLLGPYCRTFPVHDIRILTSEQTLGREQPVRDLFRWLDVEPGVPLTGVADVVNGLSVDTLRLRTILPHECRRDLEAYFADSNARLAEQWGIDFPTDRVLART